MAFVNTTCRISTKMASRFYLPKVQLSNLMGNLNQMQSGPNRVTRNSDIRSVKSVRPISRFSLTSNTPTEEVDKQILRLADVNELYIVQKPLENVGSLDEKMTQYSYDIKDGKGENIYTASHIHGPHDPFFELKIFGSDGQPIMKKNLYQTVPNGLLHMQVYSTKKKTPLVGVIQERIVEKGGKKFFELKDSENESVCIVSCDSSGKMMSRHHKIFSPDGHREIGKIFKKWNALFSGDHLKIIIDVPQHLTPQMKALLIGVPLLLGQRYTR